MLYKLLNNFIGIIETREPVLIGNNFSVQFDGAPAGSTAIFERFDGESVYRELVNGCCEIQSEWLIGEIKIVVAILDGTMRQRWFCEGVKAVPQLNSQVLIYPYDIDFQGKIAGLQEENAKLQDEVKKHAEKILELETKLIKLLEGYDII